MKIQSVLAIQALGTLKTAWLEVNDNDNDKIFYSTLIIHFIFNTDIDAFAY